MRRANHAPGRGEGRAARRLALVALFAAAACTKRVDATTFDPHDHIASGRLVGVAVSANIGAPVEVELTFKDPETPPCRMAGAVSLSRDSAHRWVWLEPKEGCPQWLGGRWWAELASGPSGWFMATITSQAVSP